MVTLSRLRVAVILLCLLSGILMVLSLHSLYTTLMGSDDTSSPAIHNAFDLDAVEADLPHKRHQPTEADVVFELGEVVKVARTQVGVCDFSDKPLNIERIHPNRITGPRSAPLPKKRLVHHRHHLESPHSLQLSMQRVSFSLNAP